MLFALGVTMTDPDGREVQNEHFERLQELAYQLGGESATSMEDVLHSREGLEVVDVGGDDPGDMSEDSTDDNPHTVHFHDDVDDSSATSSSFGSRWGKARHLRLAELFISSTSMSPRNSRNLESPTPGGFRDRSTSSVVTELNQRMSRLEDQVGALSQTLERMERLLTPRASH